MKKIFILISILIQLNGLAFASDEAVVCENDQPIPSSMPEVFSLLSTVKNEILGTIPQFCRKNGPKQLADANPGEKELNDFVGLLKKLKIPNAKDTTIINTTSETAVDGIIFTTIKTVALKKIWHQASDNIRYNILIDPSCEGLGLNRFPIHSKHTKNTSMKELDAKLLERAKKACSSSSFEQMAPFLTKDVLAESLVHLKNLFPESYPQVVDAFCESLVQTDEVIFKNDDLKDLYEEDKSISSIQDFSNWLKELYTTFSAQDAALKEQEIIQKKVLETDQDFKGVATSYAMSLGPMIIEQQKQFEDMYKYQESYPEANKMAFMTIKKSKSGVYVYTADEQTKKKQIELFEKMKEQQTQDMIDSLKEMTQKSVDQMKKIFESGQPSEMVPVPGLKNIFLKKVKEGEIVFFIKDEIKEVIKKSIEENEKALAKIKEDHEKMMEKAYSLINQEDLKKIFEIQEAYKEIDSLAYFSSIYQIEVVHDGDGKYEAKFVASGMGAYGGYGGFSYSFDGKLYDDYYNKVKIEGLPKVAISLDNPGWLNATNKDGQVIPIQTPPGTLTDANKTMYGLMTYGGMGYPTSGTWGGALNNGDSSSKSKSPLYLTLPVGEVIKKKYQIKSATPGKIETLTAEELANLRSYTGSDYRAINDCLRKDQCDVAQKKQTDSIKSALNKLRNKDAGKDENHILYRGTQDMPDAIYKGLIEESDSLVVDKGFMSATAELSVAKGFSGSMSIDQLGNKRSIFIIKTKSCVGISNVSHVLNEDEYLCPPGMKFKVKKKADSNNIFILDEVEENNLDP